MTEIIMHPQTKNDVEYFINNPSHGLIISGVQGSGKDYLSLHIISKILDKNISEIKHYPYYYSVDPKVSSSHIDDVRQLKKHLQLKPLSKKQISRFIHISNADLLNHAAQNAMLKMLEQPPVDSCIILTASSVRGLKDTIVSRAQHIKAKELSRRHVEDILDDKNDAARYYGLSDGAPGILSSLINSSEDLPINQYISQAKQMLSQTRFQRISRIDHLIKNETDLEMFLSCMYKILSAKVNIAVNHNEIDRNTLRSLHDKMQNISRSQELLSNNAQPKIVLTNLFYRI